MPENTAITADKLQKMFIEARDEAKPALDEFEEHESYYHGDQLPQDVKNTLRERGQPEHIENIYQKIGNKILGYKISTRTEIKVRARQREDIAISTILTDILRTINDSTSYNFHKKKGDLDLLLGLCVMEVGVQHTGEKDELGNSCKELVVERIPAHSFLIDPYSERLDASDAKYFHKVMYVDVDALPLYFDPSTAAKVKKINVNNYRERAEVIETWHIVVDAQKRERVWYRTIWSGDVVLHSAPTPYQHGSHPFAIRKLYTDHENRFYGIYRNIKPLQDSINFGRNRLNNMLGSVKLLFENDAVEDPESFADEFAKDNAVTGVKPGALSQRKIESIKHNSEIQQLSNIMLDDRRTADIITGLNDELMGVAANRLSASAIEQRKNLGLMGLQQFIDASLEVDKQAFGKAVSLIQQYFNAEQIFKIVEKDQAERYFAINEIDRTGDGRIKKDAANRPKRKNKIDVGRYDVIIRAIPETQGSIQERYKQGVELMKLLAQASPELVQPMLPHLLQDIESPIAQDVLEMVKKMQERQSQDPVRAKEQEIKQRQLELLLEKLEVGVDMDKAKSLKLVAEAQEEASRAERQRQG